MAPKKVGAEDIRAAILAAPSAPDRIIATKLGVSRSRVQQVRSNTGITRRKGRRPRLMCLNCRQLAEYGHVCEKGEVK